MQLKSCVCVCVCAKDIQATPHLHSKSSLRAQSQTSCRLTVIFLLHIYFVQIKWVYRAVAPQTHCSKNEGTTKITHQILINELLKLKVFTCSLYNLLRTK